MSLLSEQLQVAAAFNYPESIDSFQKNIPLEWIEQALSQTGRATVRRRRFPAEQVVWLVLGIALMRNRSISDVCDKLDLAFPDSHGNFSPMATSSLVKARQRLGFEPLRHLFYSTSEQWDKEDTEKFVCGLKVFSVDGTQFRAPDTPENKSFGFASGSNSFPSVLLVALMSARSHLITDVAFGPVKNSEIYYAQQLVSSVQENSLTLFDRAYFSAELLLSWEGAGANTHWLTPVKSKMRHKVIEQYSEYDQLIEMPVSPQARKQFPHLPHTWLARKVLIIKPSGEIKEFITSMKDPEKYPFEDIIQVYWERWEIEQGYSELKCSQLGNTNILRSQKPAGIYQEIWGILISYNLVRLEMRRMADDFNVHPLRISFINALRLIQEEFLWCSGRTPGTIPRKLRDLRESGKRLILPEKRKRPAYPREVLARPAKYPTKKKAARS